MLNLNDYLNRAFLAEFLGRISSDGLQSFLDLGCGSKPYKDLYSEYFSDITFADIENRSDRIDVVANVENLPFADESFDVVLFSEVIEHVADDTKAFAEISRILTPGGVLILTCPFMYRMHEVPVDYRRYTEFGLRNALRNAGLTVDCVRRRGNAISLVATIFGSILHGFFAALVRAPVVGLLFRPFLWIFEKLLQLTYFGMSKIQYRSQSARPRSVGDNLRGVRGYLAVWTLGYCVLAKKAKSR